MSCMLLLVKLRGARANPRSQSLHASNFRYCFILIPNSEDSCITKQIITTITMPDYNVLNTRSAFGDNAKQRKGMWSFTILNALADAGRMGVKWTRHGCALKPSKHLANTNKVCGETDTFQNKHFAQAVTFSWVKRYIQNRLSFPG